MGDTRMAFLSFVALLWAHGALAQDFNATYAVVSGSLPDAVCPPWIGIDSASPEDPFVSGGVLTISTDVDSENIAYLQTEPDIVRMRSKPGFRRPCASATRASSVA